MSSAFSIFFWKAGSKGVRRSVLLGPSRRKTSSPSLVRRRLTTSFGSTSPSEFPTLRTLSATISHLDVTRTGYYGSPEEQLYSPRGCYHNSNNRTTAYSATLTDRLYFQEQPVKAHGLVARKLIEKFAERRGLAERVPLRVIDSDDP